MPKLHPVPLPGEEATNRAEAADALCAVGREDVSEVADVSAKDVPSVGDAGGEALKEGVGARDCRVVGEGVVWVYPHEVFGVEREAQGVGTWGVGVLNDDRDALERLRFCGVAQGAVGFDGRLEVGEMEVVFVPRGDAVAADGEQMVAAAYACFLGGATAEDAVDETGAEGGGEGRLCLQHLEEVEVAREGDCGFFALAQDGGATGLGEVAEEVGAEAREALAVGTQGDVAVAEAERLGALVELEALRHALNGGVGVAPGEEHHGVDEEGEEEVDHDASDHDEQALPGGFGAKLPGLDGLLHLLCVHRFVDHAGDFDVASEGYPADVVVGAAPREEFPTFPGVEEEAEFLYANFEEFGKEEVACFMEHDEEGEAEDELEGFDEEYFHWRGVCVVGFLVCMVCVFPSGGVQNWNIKIGGASTCLKHFGGEAPCVGIG